MGGGGGGVSERHQRGGGGVNLPTPDKSGTESMSKLVKIIDRQWLEYSI